MWGGRRWELRLFLVGLEDACDDSLRAEAVALGEARVDPGLVLRHRQRPVGQHPQRRFDGLIPGRGDRAEAMAGVVEVAAPSDVLALEDGLGVELVVDDRALEVRRVE